MERKIASAEMAGFFQRELRDHPGLTLSAAQTLLQAEDDPAIQEQREAPLLGEIKELIRDHGSETPVRDFLPEDEGPEVGSPGTRG